MTLFHGLPSDRVRAIAQGIDGSLWFGTEGGLAKFDGRRTQVIKDPSLPGSRVLSLKTDDTGTLWVGTDSGAARIVGSRVDNIRETAGNAISAILASEPGRILLATEQGNIFECRTKQDGKIQTRSLFPTALESADRESPGPLVITSLTTVNGKLLLGSLSRGVLTLENGNVSEMQSRPASFFVRAIAADDDGTLWVGTRSRRDEPGLFKGGNSSLKRNEARTGTVLTIQRIGEAMFIGTDGQGVFRFADEKLERLTFDGTAGGLRSDRIYAIFPDREGVIWFGTDRGVSRFDPNAPRVETVGSSADSNFVRTLFQASNGQLFAGTNRGLFVFNKGLRGWNPIEFLARNIIYALDEDDSNNLLVGSASGFYVSQQKLAGNSSEGLTFTRLTTGSGGADALGGVRAVTRFRGQTFIASFGRGVELYQDGRIRSVWPRQAPTEVISLFADGDSQLMVGTAKDGIVLFDGQRSMADPALAEFEGFAVRSIARTPDNTLWLATSRGVYLCPREKPCSIIAGGNDARSLVVRTETDKTEVWCATTGAGLLKASIDKDVGPVVSQLDSEQGLPSQNAFAVLPQADGGQVLIGTNRGVVRYSPGNTIPTLYATRIIGKRIHQPAELATGLNLEYPQNSLLLDVAAISSRTFPEQFQYAFVLRDAAGKTIKQRLSRESQFVLEGLQPGQYRVMARAFTKDLVQSEPLIFEFNVAKAPFPWTSTALAILLALTLLALLWALLERRRIVRTSAALVTANHELADARLNLANEAERERRRIARDLHDQTLADLRNLLLLTDQLPRSAPHQPVDTTALRGEIEDISHEVRRICEDLSPSVLQNVGFSAALEFALSQAVQHAPEANRFAFEFVCPEDLEEQTNLPANVQMQIYRITQEAVNNLCRHAAPQHVKMEVSCSPAGAFILNLEDDGREFDPAEVQNSDGRGLANMRARARLIDAEISWGRRTGGGTVFTLRRGAQPAKPASA